MTKKKSAGGSAPRGKSRPEGDRGDTKRRLKPSVRSRSGPPPIQLQYHAQTLDLLGRQPEFSHEAIAAINKCEVKCKRKLPAAVREWYSLVGVEGALDDGRKDNVAEPLNGLLGHFKTKRSAPFMFYGASSANTGYFAEVLLDGADDPAVTEDQWGENLAFSQYVQRLAWDKVTLEVPFTQTSERDSIFVADVGPPHLDFLRENFHELAPQVFSYSQTYWTFRFYRPTQRVEVESKGDPSSVERQAAYRLAADSLDGLLALYELVWPVHGAMMRVSLIPGMDFKDVKRAFKRRFPHSRIRRGPSLPRL
jgi:hypothetical protein